MLDYGIVPKTGPFYRPKTSSCQSLMQRCQVSEDGRLKLENNESIATLTAT